jgi:lysophospholipase
MRKPNGERAIRRSDSPRATVRGGLNTGSYLDSNEDFPDMPKYDSDPFSRAENTTTQVDWKEVEELIKDEILNNGGKHVVDAFVGQSALGRQTKEVLIHYRMYILPKEVGAVIIVPGFTEGLTLYQEVIFDLLNRGYSVFIHDHRGQGFSSRIMEPEETEMHLRTPPEEQRIDVAKTYGYIDNFDFLVKDLAEFVKIVGRERERCASEKPLHILAHSMGGAVTMLYLCDTRYDDTIKSAALITPMFQPRMNLGTLVDDYCAGITKVLLGLKTMGNFSFNTSIAKKTLLPTMTTFDEQYADAISKKEFVDRAMSMSPIRMERRWHNRNATCEEPKPDSDSKVCGHSNAKIAGPTYGWMRQACKMVKKLRDPEVLKQIKAPVLIVQGTEDTVVRASDQQVACAVINQKFAAKDTPRSPYNGKCTAYKVPKAAHAIFHEVDEFRNRTLATVVRFFQSNSSDASHQA